MIKRCFSVRGLLDLSGLSWHTDEAIRNVKQTDVLLFLQLHEVKEKPQKTLNVNSKTHLKRPLNYTIYHYRECYTAARKYCHTPNKYNTNIYKLPYQTYAESRYPRGENSHDLPRAAYTLSEIWPCPIGLLYFHHYLAIHFITYENIF